MDPVSLARAAGAARAIYSVSEEPQLHRILTALAADEGRAASLAIADAERSDHPEQELQRAISFLRLSYQRYTTRAQNRSASLLERLRAALNQDRAWQARFQAAFIAMAVACLYQMIDDEQQREWWQRLSSGDFYATYRSEAIVWCERDIVPAAGRSGQYGFDRMVRLTKRHEEAIEALRREFERRRDAIASLRSLSQGNPRMELEAQMVGTPMNLPLDPRLLLEPVVV